MEAQIYYKWCAHIPSYKSLFIEWNVPLTAWMLTKFQLLKKLITALVYLNIWVAIAVASLCGFTFTILKKSDEYFLLFTFFATLLMYAYARLFEAPAREDSIQSEISIWTSSNKTLFILSGIAGLLGTIWFGQYLNPDIWPWLLACGIISVLYPLQYIKGGSALRNVAGLKVFIISIFFTGKYQCSDFSLDVFLSFSNNVTQTFLVDITDQYEVN